MKEGEQGVAIYNAETDKISICSRPRIPGIYHGTGDIFSSTFSGAYFLGKSLDGCNGVVDSDSCGFFKTFAKEICSAECA